MSDTRETNPSESSLLHKYQRRPGTIDHGMEYEYLMGTFVALNLINNKQVTDFEITYSDNNFDFFDDLVVKIAYLDKKSHTFLFQLRYFSRKKTININDITSNRGTIRLSKMFESFRKIPNRRNTSCLLYTTATINFNSKLSISLPQFENNITVVPSVKGDRGEKFNTGQIFQLRTLDDFYEPEFFDQLYFYSNQKSIPSLKKEIANILSHLLQQQQMDTFLVAMKEWSSSSYILTKEGVILKLAEIVFSPFIRTLSSKMCNKKSQVLREMIMNYEITLVEKFGIIENIWLVPETTSKREEEFLKQFFFLKRFSGNQELNRLKALWYMDEIPLVLKLDDWNRTIIRNGINLLNDNKLAKRLVLVGPSNEEFDDFQRIFTKFIDLRQGEIDLELFADFNISFQTRKALSLPELFNSNIEVASAFTVDDLLETTQDIITVGEKVTDLPQVYISRIVRATGEQPVNEEDIFTVFDSNVNLISSEPGCGKSTLMASLANNCPPHFWSVFVKLREHQSFLKKKPKDEEILRHFLGIESDPDTLVEKVKMAFFKSSKIYLFLDGLDEVEFVDFILNFVKCVSERGVRVWISSRTNLTEHISQRFRITPITIVRFGKPQVQEYFEKVQDKPFDLPQEIISITPLEMSLLGHVLSQGIPIQVATSPKIFETFFYVKNVDHDPLDKYELLALKFCLEAKVLTKLNLGGGIFGKALADIERNGDKLNIITKIDEDGAVFENRSYAEYFASVWFTKNTSKVKILKEFLFCEDSKNLKRMLDVMLARDNLSHLAIIDQNLELAKKYANDITNKDLGGRSPLHVICSYENVDKNLLEFVLEKNNPFEKDGLFSWTCLDYAIRAKNLYAIDKFLEMAKDSPEFDAVYQLKEVVVAATRLGYPHLLSASLQRDPDIINCRTGSEQSSLLHIAVTSKHDSVAAMIDILTQVKGVDLNVKDAKNRTPLQLVLEKGDCALGRKLLDKKANVNLIGNRRRNLLHYAVSTKKSNTTVIDFLVNEGVDINARDLDGATPLHIACRQGNFDNYNQLITNGADFKVRTLYGKTALHYAIAAEEPNLKIITDLANVGIDLNHPDCQGVTPLQLAIKQGHILIVEILSKIIAQTLPLQELISAPDKNGKSALHVACERGHYDLVTFLLRHGAFFTSDNTGKNSLHYAVSSENPNAQLVKFLLDGCIHISEKDDDGKTPLQIASELGHSEVVELLLESINQKTINEKDVNGKTALHLAAELGHDEVVELLLDAKATDEKTSNGRNTLHYSKSSEVTKLLIENKVDVNLKDSEGVTALHLACQRRQFDVVQMLKATNDGVLKATTASGRNAMHFAAATCARNTEIINFLLENDVGIIPDDAGITPLHVACSFNNNYNVDALLKAGADANSVTKMGENALHFAVTNVIPNTIMLKLLFDKNIEKYHKNKDGKTPIELASGYGYKKVADFLL